MRLTIISIALLAAGMSACQKKDDTQADPSKVTIHISSPTAGQVFHSGDTIDINAEVNYISELHGYEIHLTDTTTGDELYSDDEHVHSDHFSIAEHYVTNDTMARTLKLELTTEIDHEGHSATKEVVFKYLP